MNWGHGSLYPHSVTMKASAGAPCFDLTNTVRLESRLGRKTRVAVRVPEILRTLPKTVEERGKHAAAKAGLALENLPLSQAEGRKILYGWLLRQRERRR